MNLNDMFNVDSKQINGPINVVRLEGKVNEIKKVIYLFMDIHKDTQIILLNKYFNFKVFFIF